MQLLEAGVKEWGLALTPQQVQGFEFCYQQLNDWNERVNLTSITNCEEVQDEGRWPVVGVEVELRNDSFFDALRPLVRGAQTR
jgi:16S rRNA G527 N7-methylase RsmG